MRSNVVFTLCAAALLASCGGGGGGGGSVPPSVATPTPLVTATPVATPTPQGPGTPLAGAATLDLGGWTGWTPAGVASALQFPVQNGFDGRGETIAVLTASNINLADVTTYLAGTGVHRTGTITTYLLPGASTLASEPIEPTLDVETIAGLAPGANIVLVIEPAYTPANLITALDTIASNRLASIVSYSEGQCENAAFDASTDTVLAQVASSMVLVSSSGDEGSSCYQGTTGNSVTGLISPASDPNVIDVGGSDSANATGPTSLTSTLLYDDTNTSTGALEASGGGVSALWSIPAYQAGVSGVASTHFRNAPDVSMPANLGLFYIGGAWLDLNGTSWTAPQFAALLSEIYEYCNVGAIPNASALPYTVFASAAYGAFIDVTSGNNAYPLTLGGSSPAYTAQAGYDDASGIGVPLGTPFAKAACPNRTLPASMRRRSAASAPLQHTAAYALDLTPAVDGLVDLGARDPGTTTTVQLVISPAGSTAANEAAATDVLRNAGIAVTQTFANHLVVNASGPASAIDALFATRIDDVQQNGTTVFMPVRPVVVPASLAPLVAGVDLDDVITQSSHGPVGAHH